MNRRKFFKLAASFVAGCAIGVHAYAKVGWEQNPDWVNAPIEVEFIFSPLPDWAKQKCIPIIYQRKIPSQRFAWVNGDYEKV